MRNPANDLMSHLGDEYPTAVTFNGLRMPLVSERRWSRIYAIEDSKTSLCVSRFMDGSASVTFEEFSLEWPSWSEGERADFCGACGWLREQADFPDILRYIMQNGGPVDWSSIAISVSTRLPRDEAFEVLSRALRDAELGYGSNLAQAISLTKHPEGLGVIRGRLSSLWLHPSLWQDDDFTNWFAFEATTCIDHLIDLGASPDEFSAQVRELSKHACEGNRKSCRVFLHKHYSWLE